VQVENEEYQLKPMNCPFHVAMYKDGYYSYRDLPKRWAELGTVYRWVARMHGAACSLLHSSREHVLVLWELK
jgi:threonyl-tRNA synthetase